MTEVEIHAVEDSTKAQDSDNPKNGEDNGAMEHAKKDLKRKGIDPITHKGKKEMVRKILAKLKEGDCIKKLVLHGHGNSGLITTGAGQGPLDTCTYINGNQSEWKADDALGGLKGKFCPGAEIVLMGCNVGMNEDGAKKLHEIAQFLGTKVKAPTNLVYGHLDYDGPWQEADPDSEKPPEPKPSTDTKDKIKKKLKPKKSNRSFIIGAIIAGTAAITAFFIIYNIIFTSTLD